MEHFDKRCDALAPMMGMPGKGIIVTMSRRIAVDLYNAIIASGSMYFTGGRRFPWDMRVIMAELQPTSPAMPLRLAAGRRVLA